MASASGNAAQCAVDRQQYGRQQAHLHIGLCDGVDHGLIHREDGDDDHARRGAHEPGSDAIQQPEAERCKEEVQQLRGQKLGLGPWHEKREQPHEHGKEREPFEVFRRSPLEIPERVFTVLEEIWIGHGEGVEELQVAEHGEEENERQWNGHAIAAGHGPRAPHVRMEVVSDSRSGGHLHEPGSAGRAPRAMLASSR